jgi:hypothetical protein
VTSHLLGPGNGPLEYLAVLLVYGGLWLAMRQAVAHLELNFRRTFWVLYVGWACTIFVGNWICFRAGVMSFLPWANNALHCFVWIGLCLGFLYSTVWRRPLWEQCALFVVYSFVVKVVERALLGTWEHPCFFGLEGHWAYIVGWSLADGTYPIISRLALRPLARVIPYLVVPGRTR